MKLKVNNTDKIVIKNGLKMPSSLTIPHDVESKDWLGSGWCQYLVPDYICGISMKKAGYVHDSMFESQFPFELCNEVFWFNLKVLIKKDKNLIFRTTAMSVAKLYYWGVKYRGRKYYDYCRDNQVTIS